MASPFLYGIDFCFDPTNPGTQDPEGHYPLSYGFIQRASESAPWHKVAGDAESMLRNNDFGFQFFDLSGTLSKIDFVTVSLRPDSDSTQPAANVSPFQDNDAERLDKGQVLTSTSSMPSCGCGGANSVPFFSAGQYTIKNLGDYEMTVELRVTRADATSLEFKCDPKMQVGG